MADITPTQRLAGIVLGQPVEQWIEERRREGLSWRLIARALYEQTGRQIDVTHETVRLWSERGAA